MSSKYAIWLSLCNEIGTVRAKLLIDYFGSAENIYNADRDELMSIEGISQNMLKNVMNKDLSKAESILSSCERAGCSILTLDDAQYPEKLRNIYDPPTVLYIKGTLPDIDCLPVVGIVGTRWCTPYGYKNAENLGRELSNSGIVVSTGLAKGIDTAAATGGVDGKMPVIGVIGCGVDKVYPVSNRKLYEKVAANGAVISEYPPGTEAMAAFFPQRNRIISGVSNGVAIIEAPERSGALITAQRALEQNRDIFVLPGNVDSRACIGTNKLLREGAIPFITSDDIIDEYRELSDSVKKPIDNNAAVDYIDVDKMESIVDKLTGIERAVAESIRNKSLYADEIIDTTGIAAHTALASLTSLELLGVARRNNGKWEIV